MWHEGHHHHEGLVYETCHHSKYRNDRLALHSGPAEFLHGSVILCRPFTPLVPTWFIFALYFLYTLVCGTITKSCFLTPRQDLLLMAVADTHSTEQQESVIYRGSSWYDFPDPETVSRNGFREKWVLENSAISITICLAVMDKEKSFFIWNHECIPRTQIHVHSLFIATLFSFCIPHMRTQIFPVPACSGNPASLRSQKTSVHRAVLVSMAVTRTESTDPTRPLEQWHSPHG
ncbi:hypothetical protein MC885_008063 [Smutsia gigantea]|nr:hypothetical protein MC885_008063 [Smutsia gigantea]